MSIAERETMKTFYLKPVTDDMISEKLSAEVGEEIVQYQRVSSSHRKHAYQIKNDRDARYLEHAEKIIGDVGDFVRDCLPRFPFHERRNFDYVRTRQVEFLDKHELLVTVRAETVKQQKELCLRFDLPSFVLIPKMVYKIKGQYVYLYNHLECGISFVIGNPENPKTPDYFIDDALEEFWHLALYPYLVERLNKLLRTRAMEPSDRSVSGILLVDGEFLSKAFALASLGEFKRRTAYDVPEREPKGREKIILGKIERVGIRRALREVGKT